MLYVDHANRYRPWWDENRSDRHRRRHARCCGGASTLRAVTIRRRSRRSESLSRRSSASREQPEPSASAFPGAISPATGLVKNANSTWLIGQPLDRDLARALDRPVRVTNDANCFALSEATDGAAQGAHIVFGVILGTGTGGGIVVDGRVLEGRHRIAGEWGHNPLPWLQDGRAPGSIVLLRAQRLHRDVSVRARSVGDIRCDCRTTASRRRTSQRSRHPATPSANRALGVYEARLAGRWRASSTCSIRTSSFSAAAYRTSPDCTRGCRRW